MKIAVVGANGRVGSLVVKEAIERGYDVTGIANGANRSISKKFIDKNALDLTKENLNEFDAVVDAVGGWTPLTIISNYWLLQILQLHFCNRNFTALFYNFPISCFI